MNSIPDMISAKGDARTQQLFCRLHDELSQGLTLFWDCADEILNKSDIKLNRPSETCFSLEDNFFSALFLYSYIKGGIPESKRVLFVAVNQCLRGMVTGCDNILDNEYKQTLDTNLPIKATKFRSILDIMVSDRILVAILHKGYKEGNLSFNDILQANTASLHALLQSGVQEASEEEGAGKILKPEEVLDKIHPLKTGALFQAPWVLPQLVLPQLMEENTLISCSKIKEGLFYIGLGCQILDDMVDLSMDLQMNRHNYVASLVYHRGSPREQEAMARHLTPNSKGHADPDLLFNFPDARKTSMDKALGLLQKGTSLLFAGEHTLMVDYSIDFFIRRIGAGRFFNANN
jgi:hypothetical protein